MLTLRPRPAAGRARGRPRLNRRTRHAKTKPLFTWPAVRRAADPAAGSANFGNAWVRIADMALLYVLLALGLNIVVGYAGLLDLGCVAFFAVGAYLYGLLASPHLTDDFAGHRRHVPGRPAHVAVAHHSAGGRVGRHVPGCCWARPRSSCAGTTWPSSRSVRRDHPRVPEQPGPPGQHHQRPQGHQPDRFGPVLRSRTGQTAHHRRFEIASVTLYYYLFLVLVMASGGHQPPARGLAHRPRLDGDPRRRNRRRHRASTPAT